MKNKIECNGLVVKKEIHDVSGEGRWVTHAIYRLLFDGSVFLESYLEDDDWAGYGSSRESESFRVIKMEDCPKHIQDKFR